MTAAPADRAALRERIAEALLDHLSRTADIGPGRNDQLAFMPEIDDPERLRIADAVLAVLPAPADRAKSTAPLAANLPLVKGHCPACNGASLFLGEGGYVTCSRIDCPEPDAASTVLERRVADEAPQPETRPQRGDAFEQWLKAQRDGWGPKSPPWNVLDDALDLYRLHADTGTPLGEHVCEGRAAGDCDCLEQPVLGAALASETGPEVDSKPAGRAAILREAAARLDNIHDYPSDDAVATGAYLSGMDRAANELRRMADEAQQPEAVSPAYARLQAAAKEANEAAHLHAIHGMKRVFQLARRYGTKAIPAAEVLEALRLDENANTVEPEPGTCGHRSSDGYPCNESSGHLGYHRNARQGGNEWTSWVGDLPAAEEADGKRVVAYRSRDGRALYCTRHRDELGAYWTPVTSEDLEDGGICTYTDCGADVLIVGVTS